MFASRRLISLAVRCRFGPWPVWRCRLPRQRKTTPTNRQGDVDYLASQKTISATFDPTVEVITADLEKIQLTVRTLPLSCPDKLHATRTGGYSMSSSSRRKVVTIYGKNLQPVCPGGRPRLVDR